MVYSKCVVCLGTYYWSWQQAFFKFGFDDGDGQVETYTVVSVLMKAGYPKQIATTASLFILINSISGILGQLTKENVINEILNYWPLFIVVLIGGQLGNFLNLRFLSNKILAVMTSLLVIFVAIRLGLRLLS